jgi:hypothetical protein
LIGFASAYRPRFVSAALTLACALSFGGVASAQMLPLTPGVQAIMFSKIFSYVKTIDDPARVSVLVVVTPDVEDPAAIVEAFENEKIDAGSRNPEEALKAIGAGSIVYFPAGVETRAFRETLERYGGLSLSGDPAAVERGDASIGVGLQNRKAKILINLPRLEAERHKISSELMNLAIVYR